MLTKRQSLRSLSALALGCLALGAPANAQSLGATFDNNIDGYIEIPYDASLVPQAGITVEAWIKYDGSTLPTGWRFPTVLRQNLNAGQEAYFLRVEAGTTKNNSLRWLVNTTGSGPTSIEWNFGAGGLLEWTHVAATYDGSQLKLYANGNQVASGSASGSLIDNGEVLRIGKGSDVGDPAMEVFNGSIDEVRLWPFARTEAEIKSTRKRSLFNLPGQVSTWSLDGHTQDFSGSNHGSATGSVSFGPTGVNMIVGAFQGANFGASTPGCLGPIHAAVGSLPEAGNTSFSMVAHKVPTGAPVFAYLGQSVLSTPLPLAGIDVLVNPATAFGLYPAAVNNLGVARLNFGIPINFPVGLAVAFQFAAVDPCGSQGFSASNAVGMITMPKALTPFP